MTATIARSRAFVVAGLVATLVFIGVATTTCLDAGASAQSCIGKTVGC